MNPVRTHRFLDDIALADIAFEARGKTPIDLILAVADALIATMATPSSIKPRFELSIELDASDLPELVFVWLSEIFFLKDAESMVFCETNVTIQEGPPWKLTGYIRGDTPHIGQLLGNDVKAVTKHMYSVLYDKNEWIAQVVLDV